jgi:hypothetical protein
MTQLRPDDWDDDRLSAAFTARAAKTPPVPSHLVEETIASTGRRRNGLLGWAPVPAMAVALILVAALSGPYIGRPTPGTSGLPGGTPTGSAAPDPVLEALGAPISVSEALAIRDSEVNQQEIVVEGFLSAQPILPCPFEPGPRNPTHLRCSENLQWLMEEPEDLYGTTKPGSNELRPPNGPALHPSFALVDSPVVPLPEPDNTLPVPVVLLGHFHDRRARLCDASEREGCEQTFLVDRVVADDGAAKPVATRRSTDATTTDRESDVDALVAGAAPGAIVVSRQLMTVAEVFAVEPSLKNDQLLPYVDQSKLAWIVTTVDLIDGVPVARTFMLLDGSNWFAEVTQSGALILERSAPAPSGRPSPLAPSAQPGSFDSAPASVLGIRVRSIREVAELRQGDDRSAWYRDEFAIRAYYLAPRPGVTCDPALPPMHAPSPPCDEARAWLVGDPQQYGAEPGQLRRDPDPYAPVLNPLLPVGVPFDVGDTWPGGVPAPQPLILLGHFADTRVDAYRGDAYLVIDALVWTRDLPVGSIDRVDRMTDATTEDSSAAIARIEAISPNEALATWAIVVDSADFAALEPYVAQQVTDEFTTGPPVWIVRRMIQPNQFRPEAAVEIGFTADGRSRVWWAESANSQVDLATSIDLPNLDATTSLLRVFDYGDSISSVSTAENVGSPEWHELGPVPDFIDVARGQSDREVLVRWRGSICDRWRLNVHEYEAGILLDPRQDDPRCDDPVVRHRVVIRFDHPVDIDIFTTEDLCCG